MIEKGIARVHALTNSVKSDEHDVHRDLQNKNRKSDSGKTVTPSSSSSSGIRQATWQCRKSLPRVEILPRDP